jgi:hypothetical protein
MSLCVHGIFYFFARPMLPRHFRYAVSPCGVAPLQALGKPWVLRGALSVFAAYMCLCLYCRCRGHTPSHAVTHRHRPPNARRRQTPPRTGLLHAVTRSQTASRGLTRLCYQTFSHVVTHRHTPSSHVVTRRCTTPQLSHGTVPPRTVTPLVLQTRCKLLRHERLRTNVVLE